MKEIIDKITRFLSAHDNNFLDVSNGELRMMKETSKLKYAFTLTDIQERFGSIENFIKSLPSQGYADGTMIKLRRFYYQANNKISYQNYGKITLKFKKKMDEMDNYISPQPTPQPAPMPQMAMGYTPVAQNEWLSTKVKESRYDDIKTELRRTQDELSDVKSKLRIAEEKASSLQLKLDTADERFELKLQRKLLDRKGFFESPAFEKMTEAMGAVLPQLMASQIPKPALGSPNLSQIKQALITAVGQDIVTDEMAQQLLMNLQEMFNKNEGNGEE